MDAHKDIESPQEEDATLKVASIPSTLDVFQGEEQEDIKTSNKKEKKMQLLIGLTKKDANIRKETHKYFCLLLL